MRDTESASPIVRSGSEIAIIGLSGRFPGAANVDQFWENLRAGVESVRFLTEQEIQRVERGSEKYRQPGFVSASATMDDIEFFDARFFDISPKEAELLDPQHRIFLEECWTAMESAGYGRSAPGISVGVFGGATINTYLLANLAGAEQSRQIDPVQLNVASSSDFLTTRVSYKLNFTGPSHVVQCACSTSLVAVHTACQKLLDGECDIALAGGVCVNLLFRSGYTYISDGILSPDGHCRPFDKNAQGTVFGNGVGVVVLKRLTTALADGDTVRAIILGSAINNDGSLKVSYTAPSVDGQAAVIIEALSNAGVDPGSITYVEAHGTGTPLGDPAELHAITKAYRQRTDRKSFCAIGSVKGNIGHLDAAAGVAGLIKVVLSLEHQQLAPTINFESPNPHASFDDSPFFVNTSLSEWTADGLPRRAGVSAFGVGGTNAHLILQEANQSSATGPSRRDHLLTLSARSLSSLSAAAQNLAIYFERNPGVPLADAAYTLHTGRTAFAYRLCVTCSAVDEAIEKLRIAMRTASRCEAGSSVQVVLAFPESIDIAVAQLWIQETEFRAYFNAVYELLIAAAGLSRDCPQDALEWIEQTANESPLGATLVQFAIQYALARTWQEMGLSPTAIVADGIGEYAAATISGMMTPSDAVAMVYLSAQVEPRSTQTEELARVMAGAQIQRASAETVPLYVDGGSYRLTQDEARNRNYWIDRAMANRRGAVVRTRQGVAADALMLQVGFGGTWRTADSSFVPAVSRERGHVEVMSPLGALWLRGLEPNWTALHRHERRRRIPLPTYPFDRQRYWIDPPRVHTQPVVGKLSEGPPLYERPDLDCAYARPETSLEVALTDLWRATLGVDKIGAEDNFFDLGGNSLLAQELAERVRDKLGMGLPVAKLFEFVTIRSLAQALSVGAVDPLKRADNATEKHASNRNDRLNSQRARRRAPNP